MTIDIFQTLIDGIIDKVLLSNFLVLAANIYGHTQSRKIQFSLIITCLITMHVFLIRQSVIMDTKYSFIIRLTCTYLLISYTQHLFLKLENF